ncbi:MAG: serine/threonine-protein kinase [Actinomycetota bacterium]
MPPNGLVLGRYRPLRPLGSGGSGTVWLARDETSGIEVALKIIAKEGRAAPRAEREAEAATRLRHPHCLRAYGLESDDKHLYIPYEYVAGSTLRQAIRSGELRDDGAVEAAAQILEALAFAHARGIVHRDVKPANVLVVDGESLSVRLFDFGLAQLADAETLTAVGDVPGTLAYISPERLHGETAGPPADVWAVGVLLWEALSGHHPFWRDSPLETGEVIKTGAPSIGEARPDLPERLVAAVDGALSVDPAERPSAGSLSKELRDAWWERAHRPERQPKPRFRIDPRRALERSGAPALAALATGWVAATLPFYPARWPLLLAAVAATLTLARARLGLAFTLAVPLFPLGNVSLGLLLGYAALAAIWLALMWGDPRRGLLFVSGIVLGPIGLLGLLPVAVMHVGNSLRRSAHALVAVLLAAVVAGLHGWTIPFSGAEGASLGIAGSEHPIGVFRAIWQWLLDNPALGVEALILAATAGALPYVMRRADLSIAAFAAVLISATLLAAPRAGALPLVLAGWITYLALTVLSRRLPQQIAERRSFVTLATQTRALLLDRLKAAGGPRWPRPQRRFRQAGAR